MKNLNSFVAMEGTTEEDDIHFAPNSTCDKKFITFSTIFPEFLHELTLN